MVASALAGACLITPAWAERVLVSPGEANLQSILDRAKDDDVITLSAGEHSAPLRLSRKLVLEGEPGAILVGPVGAGLHEAHQFPQP